MLILKKKTFKNNCCYCIKHLKIIAIWVISESISFGSMPRWQGR